MATIGYSKFCQWQPVEYRIQHDHGHRHDGYSHPGARVVVLNNPMLPKSERTFSRFFRPDVFRLPAVGTFGNAARTVIRGPGITNWDIALFKNIPVNDRMRFQLRCETYNTLSHTQFSDLDTAARFNPATGEQVNTRFGELIAARSPRIMQLALRFLF